MSPAMTPWPGASKQLHTFERTLDLFQPPQRQQIRQRAVALAVEGLTYQQIAQRLEEKPTATAVGDALFLDSKMRELGLQTPYVTLLEPPADYSKLRRHRNRKYRFQPLEGYESPPL